jgi:hypothetical protein
MNNHYITAQKITITLIKSFFTSKNALISTPIFNISTNGITVQVFYYIGPTDLKITEASLKTLSNTISSLFIKESTYPHNFTVELQVVRQYRPYSNANILAQYLAINASKYGFHRMMTILLNAVPYVNPDYLETVHNSNTNHVASCTTGVKVQLSGLLTSQRNRSRKTVYNASAGTFHGTNTTIDFAQSTHKSRLGAFTVKV